MKVQGHFINLDASIERRLQFERQLNLLGLQGVMTRFPATQVENGRLNLSSGEVGCFTSHLRAISTASSSMFTIIMEDDSIISPLFRKALPRLLRSSEKNWDILFLNTGIDFMNLPRVMRLLALKKSLGDVHSPDFRNFRLMDGRSIYSHGTCAYVIKPESAKKIAALLEAELQAEAVEPVDITFRKLIRNGRIEAKILFPFLTGVQPRFPTTLPDRESSKDIELYSSIVNIFLAGPDLGLRGGPGGTQIHANEEVIDHDCLDYCQILYRKLVQK